MQDVKALVFDVFGTVVDYRSTIIYEGEALNRQKALFVDQAYIPRPLEHGPDTQLDLAPDPAFTLVAKDLLDLAQQLGT